MLYVDFHVFAIDLKRLDRLFRKELGSIHLSALDIRSLIFAGFGDDFTWDLPAC